MYTKKNNLSQQFIYFSLIWLIQLFQPMMTLASEQASTDNQFAKTFTIDNNRHLYLRCSGSGYPTVLLESGYRGNSDAWTMSGSGEKSLFSSISEFTRACVYDRPGTIGMNIGEGSRSDNVAMPRSGQDIVRDLHALLQTANEHGPFIFVGHSLGGMLIRIYENAYPEDVAGLILVDAFPENLKENLGPILWKSYLKILYQVPEWLPATAESIDFDKLSIMMKRLDKESPLHPMPLTVLSRGQAPDLSLYSIKSDLTSSELEQAWQKSQRQLALLLPNAKLQIAKKSGHDIHLDEPDMVITAVHETVSALRMP